MMTDIRLTGGKYKFPKVDRLYLCHRADVKEVSFKLMTRTNKCCKRCIYHEINSEADKPCSREYNKLLYCLSQLTIKD